MAKYDQGGGCACGLMRECDCKLSNDNGKQSTRQDAIDTQFGRVVPPSRFTERFYLTQDNDSNWYVVPVANERDWNNWLGSDEYYDGDVPDYAVELGGSPSLVTFTDWRVGR